MIGFLVMMAHRDTLIVVVMNDKIGIMRARWLPKADYC